jgi:hypothetical protein
MDEKRQQKEGLHTKKRSVAQTRNVRDSWRRTDCKAVFGHGKKSNFHKRERERERARERERLPRKNPIVRRKTTKKAHVHKNKDASHG